MSTQCVKITYKDSASNDNLTKFDVLTLFFKSAGDSNGNRIVIQGASGEMKIIGDGKFTNTGSTYDASGNLGKTQNAPFIGWASDGNYKMEISDKRNISGSFNAGKGAFDIAELAHNTSLTSFTAPRSFGNLAVLNNFTNLTGIHFGGIGILGELNVQSALTTLNLVNSSVTGPLEDFVERNFASIGNILFTTNGTTIGEYALSSGWSGYIKKTNGVVEVTNYAGDFVYASYDGESWTYHA